MNTHFNLARIEQIVPEDKFVPHLPEMSSPVEGTDIIYELLPVSKVTGLRANTITLLQMALSPKYQGLIPQILQDLPTLPSDGSLTDEDRCEMLAYRLCTGTPAENEQFTKQLMNVIGDLSPKAQESIKDGDPNIHFNNQDAEIIDKA
jgi:hypothetical protein